MKSRFENSMKDFMAQIKKADQVVKDFADNVAHIDRQAARSKLDELKGSGIKEAFKIRDRLKDQLVDLSKEFSETASRLKSESHNVKTYVDETLNVLKTQIKGLAEGERKKRRTRKSKSKNAQ